MSNTLLSLKNINKSFKRAGKSEFLVLKDINFTMKEGEIVALLGKSGSGKSTLLRIISGLIKPSNGEAFFEDDMINKPVQGIAMVFQSFALMPWLTVLGNVELGLEALGVAADERRRRALKAIDTIGLDGFESAYPKELSGGMRQRVGLARALVVEPNLLLLDEAFSALDVLTAENLRTDLLDLWHEKQTRIKGILQVTHNIEEAVMMADRIIIFSSDPGEIKTELKVDIPHPRASQDEKVRELINEVYLSMTSKRIEKKAANIKNIEKDEKVFDISHRLPDIELSELTGLLETLTFEEEHHRGDLSEIADDLHLNVDDLFPIIETLDILKFAFVKDGILQATEVGKLYAEEDILNKKKIFARQLEANVPLAHHIKQVIMSSPNQRVNEDVFVNELEKKLSEEEAERVLETAIDWGRYAELYAYDFDTGELSLENPK